MQSLLTVCFVNFGIAVFFYIARKAQHSELDSVEIYRVPASIAAVFLAVPMLLSYALVFQILPQTQDRLLSVLSVGMVIALCFLGTLLMWRLRLTLEADAMEYLLVGRTHISYASIHKMVLKRDRLLVVHYGDHRVIEISRLVGDFDDMVRSLRQRCPDASFEDTLRRRTE